jgi:outer membrane protein assembly factor BamD
MSPTRRLTPVLRLLVATAVAVAGLAGCTVKGFNPSSFAGNNERLYAAGMREFQKKKWDNAVTAFEKLTLDLPARDTLLPLSYYYLGRAHEKRGEHLLAAQSYSRLVETFPDDTLADDALFGAGEAYKQLWRKPVLDKEYGQTAIQSYQALLSLYPNSPLRDRTTKAIEQLEEWLAKKDFETGMFYLRRKAYDSAIIYFRDVTKHFPSTRKSRDAYLRLVDAYRKIHYREDVAEVCATLRQSYPGDRDVRKSCGNAPATAATPQATPASAAKPEPAQ